MTATTIAGAFAVLRARAEAVLAGQTLLWQDEEFTLPDTPAPFIYFELTTDPGFVSSFGDGTAQNRYRNPSMFSAYVFVPRGWGALSAMTRGEAVAAAFRSYRTPEVSCFESSVHPIGRGESVFPDVMRDNVASNYSGAVVVTDCFFDQIG